MMTTTNASTTKMYCACSDKWCEFANLQGFCTLTACCKRVIYNDTIYRQAAIDAVCKAGCESGYCGIPCDDVKAIEQLPSAQPKTGRWIKATGMMPPEFHGHHICSECGNFANMCPPFGNREDLSDFCPNCGLRMENG